MIDNKKGPNQGRYEPNIKTQRAMYKDKEKPELLTIAIEEIDQEVNSKTASATSIEADIRIDLSKDILPPPTAISVDGLIWGTLGGFSTITGKAKARKTFLISAITASVLSNKKMIDHIEGELPENKNRVLYFDTEQPKYMAQRVGRRILGMAGLSTRTNLIEVYSLRGRKTDERREVINDKIMNSSDVGLVIIDGVRDLIRDINSPDEATSIVDDLMAWSDVKEIHIVAILHQNKTDENIRGHIGTEILNKAEIIVKVTKQEDSRHISTVSVYESRYEEFEPFAFTIDENDTPIISDIPETIRPGRKRVDPSDQNEDFHAVILKEVFSNSKKMNQNKFKELIIHHCSKHGTKIGEHVVRKYVTHYTEEGYVREIPEGRSLHYELSIRGKEIIN